MQSHRSKEQHGHGGTQDRPDTTEAPGDTVESVSEARNAQGKFGIASGFL